MSIGTTSFRVDQLNYKNECQLRYLNELFISNLDMKWDKALQAKYFDLLVSKDFIEDYEAIKDKDAREKTYGIGAGDGWNYPHLVFEYDFDSNMLEYKLLAFPFDNVCIDISYIG